MNIISRCAVAIYDGGNQSPMFPAKPWKPAEEACEYLSAVAEKLLSSDGSRLTAVEPGSVQEDLLRRFVQVSFKEAADALLLFMDDRLQTLEILREGFDIVIFTFDRDNDPHLCVASLPYRSAVVHQVEPMESGEGVETMLLPHAATLPPPGAKGTAGFVVNLSTGDIHVRDMNALTNVGNLPLFSEAIFTMAKTRTTKEAVKAVTQSIREAAPDLPPQELAPVIKRAMERSIEEQGAINVPDVVNEVFRSDPEREAIIEQVSRQMQEEFVEPVIPVENSKRMMTQLQKLKIRTDNGISITLPRTLADDENSFAVVQNDDGTISIIISRVQELKTE